jgi:hypothetical protein
MYTILLALVVMTVPSPARHSQRTMSTRPVDTVGCRRAAISAVKHWFLAIATGDTAAVRKVVSPTFGVISAGRNGWPEPFFRAERIDELFAYVKRRAAHHERIEEISVPTGGWHDSRIMLGVVSYTRTADDIPGTEHWLGKGEYACHRGIYVLNTAPQGSPNQRR